MTTISRAHALLLWNTYRALHALTPAQRYAVDCFDTESEVQKMLRLGGWHPADGCGVCHGPLEQECDAVCLACSAQTRGPV